MSMGVLHLLSLMMPRAIPALATETPPPDHPWTLDPTAWLYRDARETKFQTDTRSQKVSRISNCS